MSHLVLASEGGYQSFKLGGAEFFWLFFAVATAITAILVGFSLMRGVLAADQGTDKMKEIAVRSRKAPSLTSSVSSRPSESS